MILILADPHDATAQRVAALARERHSAADVRTLASLDLVRAPHWSHRIGVRGAATELRLADGTTLDGGDVNGVFNRMSPVPAWAFGRFDAADREYAQSELHALLVSWLAGLRCPVVNPASPHALCGSSLSTVRWRVAAHRAGLATLAMRFTTSQRRFPAAGMVKVNEWGGTSGYAGLLPFVRAGAGSFVGAPGTRAANVLIVGAALWSDGLAAEECEGLSDACRRLARDVGLSLLRIHFVSSEDERGWLFCGANALPDVHDAAPLRALVDLIAGESPACVNDRDSIPAAR